MAGVAHPCRVQYLYRTCIHHSCLHVPSWTTISTGWNPAMHIRRIRIHHPNQNLTEPRSPGPLSRRHRAKDDR